MTYHVEISSRAKKELKKLDYYTQKIILLWLKNNIDGCKNPRILGKPLVDDKKGRWRYRIGDYRIVCEIKDDRLIVLAIAIGHRKEIYKKTT